MSVCLVDCLVVIVRSFVCLAVYVVWLGFVCMFHCLRYVLALITSSARVAVYWICCGCLIVCLLCFAGCVYVYLFIWLALVIFGCLSWLSNCLFLCVC